jgi:hypothetical protein
MDLIGKSEGEIAGGGNKFSTRCFLAWSALRLKKRGLVHKCSFFSKCSFYRGDYPSATCNEAEARQQADPDSAFEPFSYPKLADHRYKSATVFQKRLNLSII